MSHFSVLVTGEDIKEALAPFDEDLDVPRYMANTKAELIAKERRSIEQYRDGLYAEFLADKKAYIEKCKNPDHLVYLFEEFPKKLTWTDDEVYADVIRYHAPEELDDEGNEWSERNPQSKWDYWRIGGRWAGELKLKSGATGHSEPLSWEWGYGDSSERPNPATTADQARKGDVDLDATKATYAIVHDGQWIARGRMGWFGMSLDEEITEEEWPAKWREFVEALPDETPLTVVDCHI